MKKQLVIIAIITLLITIGFSGCNQEITPLTPEQKRFVGTWENLTSTGVTNTIIFSENHSFSAPLIQWKGTWNVTNNTLVTKAKSVNGTEYVFEYTYVFSNNNTTLAITSITDVNSTIVYTKSTEQPFKDKLLGDWISKDYYDGWYDGGPDKSYTFYANNTCSYTIDSPYYAGKIFWDQYEITNDYLSFTNSRGNVTAYLYSFSNDYQNITLTLAAFTNYTSILERQ